jgi:hypothetical protein
MALSTSKVDSRSEGCAVEPTGTGPGPAVEVCSKYRRGSWTRSKLLCSASRQPHKGLRADQDFPHSAEVHVLVLMVVGIQFRYGVHADQSLLYS